jgi:hypothetical protein
MITADLSKSTGASYGTIGNITRRDDGDDVIMLKMILFGFFRAWKNAA